MINKEYNEIALKLDPRVKVKRVWISEEKKGVVK
jgi:hypothetical protein